ncbi:hypothetical protein BDV24DRAFT_126073 [Aspergillus arachidicola]|uniref:Uncharacterized protein n=1 Tax=Aspergillus arachidicola TaxID=656916 RepID=A0A5N6YHP5_9EURO|nr:hypothetical protein BDV24DRAFT_126073 [Aspergillus arachidicola]
MVYQRRTYLTIRLGSCAAGMPVSISLALALFPLGQSFLRPLRRGVEYQTAPLTPAELEERRPGFPRFWTEPNVPGQRLRMATALTSLEVAAQFGCEEIFEILYKAGAEDSSWRVSTATQEDSLSEIPSEAPLSALLVSSPMHQAIASGHRLMLDKILNTYNYYPDYRPLVTPTVALPPLFFAIARCDLAKPGVRECISDLFAHPRLSPHLRTPILEVHPLHFATARHDPEFLSWTADLIPGGHATAGRIALGHTLLHVAALPLTGNQVARNKMAIERSIH